jgi:serine protease Do
MSTLAPPFLAGFAAADEALTAACAAVVQRVQRSLVILHNGRFGIGAGVIWPVGGAVSGTYILTNHHVVAHGRSLRVALEDGREFPARRVAEDPEVDLALLHIEATNLEPIAVADPQAIRTGQLVLAVGHPWGQRGVVTAGLVSSRGQAHTRGPRQAVAVLRSDARLAPGNSGGPLVNAAGEVVGINTMIVGGDQGIAIASQVAAEFVAQAIKTQ